MNKTVNMLLYLPSYGGNFIRFLLSLDDSTYPIHFHNKTYDDSIPRKQLYSYKNLFHKHGSWDSFEQSFLSPVKDPFIKFINQDKWNITTINYHPGFVKEGYGFFGYFLTLYNDHMKEYDINYLQVSLSEKYKSINDFFKKMSNNTINRSMRVSISWKDMEYYYKEYTLKYNPYQINLDNFLEGKDTFVYEYEKLCDHVKLPKHTDDALELYEDWYRSRRFKDFLSTIS